MMYRMLGITLIALTLFSSCYKEENVNNAPADMVVGGFLSTYINGGQWVADTGFATIPHESTLLQLYAENNPKTGTLRDITINIHEYHGPDTYDISDTGTTSALYYHNITRYWGENGKVTITQDDSVHVRGSFSFLGAAKDGSKLELKNGQFDLILK